MTMLPAGHVAPIPRRVIAYLIDAAIAFGISMLLGSIGAILVISTDPSAQIGAMFGASAIVLVGAAAWAVVYTVMQGGNGSVGMRAQKLRLVTDASGEPLGFGKALLRNLVFWLTCTIVVGYFSVLFDGTGRFQGWHDKAVGAVMVNAAVSAAPSFRNAPPPSIQHAPVPPHQYPPAPTTDPQLVVPPRPPLPESNAQDELDETVAAAPRTAAPSAVRPAPAVAPVPALPSVIPAPSAVPAVPTAGPSAPVAPSAPLSPTADPSGNVIAFVPGITQDTPPARLTTGSVETTQTPAFASETAPSQIVPPIPAAVQDTPEDIDDEEDLEETRISIPGHRLVFTWDDGTKVAVSHRTIFGRNPQEEDGAVAVAVRDETLSLSKTHFEAGAEPNGGWVIDRHSTNGVTIVRDGERLRCVPGERTRLRLGDAIEIGERIVTIGGYA